MTQFDRTTGVHAIIPVKNPADAKQRLSDVLDAAGREDFFRAMVSDVLDAVTGCLHLDTAWIVTRDDAIRDAAFARGLNALREPANDGQSAAVRHGMEHVIAQRARTVMTIPADMPLVTSLALDDIIQTHEPLGLALNDCTLVPDTAQLGTNIILMSPPGLIDVNFGNTSYAPHVAAAEAIDAGPTEIVHPALGLDIDRPSDLVALDDHARNTPDWNTRTQRWLVSPVGRNAVANARRVIREG